MKIKDLQALFVQQLKDLYSAEKQLTKALPRMAKAASHDDLRQAFQSHFEETRQQQQRLEEVFGQLDVSPRGTRCAAMAGLIEEAEEALEDVSEPEVRDAALICAAQRVEHYEIAGYGCVRSLAEQLGMSDLAGQLQQTLEEEKKSNEKLNKMALGHINKEAAQSGSGNRESGSERSEGRRGNGHAHGESEGRQHRSTQRSSEERMGEKERDLERERAMGQAAEQVD